MHRNPRFLRWFLVTLVGAGGLSATVNVVGNPYGEFPTDLVPPTYENELEGKVMRFERLASRPDALILGSSRSTGLPPAALREVGARQGFNFALTASATARDGSAALNWSLGGGASVNTVLIGVEADYVQKFESGGRGSRARDLVRENLEGASPGGTEWWELPGKLLRSLNVAYLGESWTSLTTRPKERADDLVIEPDGLLRHPRAEEERAAGVREAEGWLEETIRFHMGEYRNFTEPDPVEIAFLQDLVRRAIAEGAAVRIFHTPFHPDFADALVQEDIYGRVHDRLMDALLSLCAPNVHVLDFARPESYGGTTDEFFDATHTDSVAGRKMILAAHDASLDLCRPDES
ncbi:MAG: hypothetical protein HYT80_09500 [Euryarchaeota archaeon]|nr:hypothetical protein [Euryarchaeota archaeon]